MTCPIAPKSLILAACMSLASLVHAGQGPQDNNQLKDALHAILMHGDLADLPELSAELGIGLRCNVRNLGSIRGSRRVASQSRRPLRLRSSLRA